MKEIVFSQFGSNRKCCSTWTIWEQLSAGLIDQSHQSTKSYPLAIFSRMPLIQTVIGKWDLRNSGVVASDCNTEVCFEKTVLKFKTFTSN